MARGNREKNEKTFILLLLVFLCGCQNEKEIVKNSRVVASIESPSLEYDKVGCDDEYLRVRYFDEEKEKEFSLYKEHVTEKIVSSDEKLKLHVIVAEVCNSNGEKCYEAQYGVIFVPQGTVIPQKVSKECSKHTGMRMFRYLWLLP